MLNPTHVFTELLLTGHALWLRVVGLRLFIAFLVNKGTCAQLGAIVATASCVTHWLSHATKIIVCCR